MIFEQYEYYEWGLCLKYNYILIQLGFKHAIKAYWLIFIKNPWSVTTAKHLYSSGRSTKVAIVARLTNTLQCCVIILVIFHVTNSPKNAYRSVEVNSQNWKVYTWQSLKQIFTMFFHLHLLASLPYYRVVSRLLPTKFGCI